MAFRDDRDALRAQRDAMRRELEAARGELDDARDAKERAAELEARLRKAEARLAAMDAPPRRWPWVVGGLVAMTAVAAGVWFWYARSVAAEARRLDALVSARELARPPAVPSGDGWEATVSAGRSIGVEPGDACLVRLTVDDSAGHRHASIDHRLRVVCDETQVFDSRVTCEPETDPRVCRDDQGSSLDHDPRVHFDLVAQTLQVEDGPVDPWSLSLRVAITTPP